MVIWGGSARCRPHISAAGAAAPCAHFMRWPSPSLVKNVCLCQTCRQWSNTQSVVKQVDTAGDVLHNPVKALQQALACVRAACHDAPVALADAAQLQRLCGWWGRGKKRHMRHGASGLMYGVPEAVDAAAQLQRLPGGKRRHGERGLASGWCEGRKTEVAPRKTACLH